MVDLCKWRYLVTTGCLGLLNACGAPSQGTQIGVDAHGSSDSEGIVQSVEASFSAWHGSPQDRQAVEVLTAYKANGAYSQCMVAAGYPVYWQTLVPHAAEWPALGATRWLREPMKSTIADPKRTSAARDVLDNADEQREISDAEARQGNICRDRIESVSELDAIGWPEGLDDLSEKWNEVTSKAVFAVAGNEQAFVDCVVERARETSGLKLASGSFVDMIGSVGDQMIPLRPPPAEIPALDEPTTADWQRYADPEQEYLAAAWHCQEPTYDEAMRALPPVVASFERENAELIAALQAHWEEVRAEATKAGWSPQNPYADPIEE